MKRPDLMMVLSLVAVAGVLISTAFRAGADGDLIDQAKRAGVEILRPAPQQNMQNMKVGELVFVQRQQRSQH